MAGKKLAPEVQALSDVLTALKDLGNDEEKKWVLATAATRLGVAIGGGLTLQAPAGTHVTNTEDLSDAKPKDFMRAKAPKSDVQRVACLAFYLTHNRNAPQFKAADLTALNTDAAGPRVNMPRAVNNATNQNRYLAAAGGGQKQITALGEDVVKALPDQEAVKAAEQRAGKPRRRRKKTSPKSEKK